MAQQSQSKMLVESRSRDIRRRVDVIQKKLADLQELGVPCAFCYSSVRNTGSIFTLGDSRITDVMERHKNEILRNLIDGGQLEGKLSKEIHLILPPLPAPLDELSRGTLQSLIGGILKDLGLKWTDPRPNWWPLEIPFVHPRSVPDNFAGNWTQALKKILESVYGYFSYDVNSYIAGQLDPFQRDQRNHSATSPTTTTSAAADSVVTSEDSSEAVGQVFHVYNNSSVHSSNSSVKESQRSVFAVDNTFKSSESASEVANKKTPSKSVSSFTVENILMGRQSSSGSSNFPSRQSSSGSSNSPTSTTTGSSLTSPTLAPSEHSTVVGTNWVSHPPVKYTKFTMLSPNSMAEDTQKKKRASIDGADLELHSQLVRSSSSHDLRYHGAPTSSAEERALSLRRVSSNVSYSSLDKQVDRDPLPPSSLRGSAVREAAASLIALSTSQKPSKVQQVTTLHSQTFAQPAKISTIPLVHALPTSSSDGKTAVLHQTFPPPQQFVLLVPSSNVATSAHGLQAVVYAHPNQPVSSQSQVNQVTGEIITADTSRHNTVAPNTQSSSSQSESTAHNSLQQTQTTYASSHLNADRNSPQSPELVYRPIAPKSDTPRGGHGTGKTKSGNPNDKMKLYLKRTMQKPQKLRFHMTTVVNRPKRSSVTTSMTAQSPRACSNEEQRLSPNSRENEQHSDSDMTTEIPQPATITRSPNVFSAEYLELDKKRSSQRRRTKEPDSNLNANLPGSPRGSHDEKRTQSQTGAVCNELQFQRANSQSKNHLENRDGAAGLRSKRHGGDTVSRERDGKATRNYTRRKRELTFHLYEDPSTAFKAKRTCKEKDQ